MVATFIYDFLEIIQFCIHKKEVALTLSHFGLVKFLCIGDLQNLEKHRKVHFKIEDICRLSAFQEGGAFS